MWRMPRGAPGHDLIQKITPANRQKPRILKLVWASQDFVWPRWRNRRWAGCELHASTIGGTPMSSRVVVWLAFAISLVAGGANAAERPVVVELFTSQGC